MNVRTTSSRASGGALLITLLIAGCGSTAPHDPASDQASSASSVMKTVSVEASWAYDIEDQTLVAGASDSIFVGTVLEKLDSTSRMADLPETQYTVHVNSVLKGDVSGDITISQQGGIDAEKNTLLLLENDPLVEAGSAYLFTAVLDPKVGWYTITPVTGHQDIPVDTASQLEGAGRGRAAPPELQSVTDMRIAIENEVVPSENEVTPN
ncbi:hypothetical protein ABH922_005747 [Rhodococcus sp. 27YEA15]|uniref:hypothetical protein n=1 Tax=Rhodococcus sp. 27YEA15 TaxID=3156259 RepID=UPI003C7B3BE9